MCWLLVRYVYFVIFILSYFVYNNYLHIKPLQLADMLFDSTFLSLFSVAFCQKYVMLETDLMSEEGHFFTHTRGGKTSS